MQRNVDWDRDAVAKERLITREYQFPWGGEDKDCETHRCIRKTKTRYLSKTNSISYYSSLRLQQRRVEHMVWEMRHAGFCQQLFDSISSFYYIQTVPRQITTHCSDSSVLKSGGSQWMCRTRWMLLCPDWLTFTTCYLFCITWYLIKQKCHKTWECHIHLDCLYIVWSRFSSYLQSGKQWKNIRMNPVTFTVRQNKPGSYYTKGAQFPKSIFLLN